MFIRQYRKHAIVDRREQFVGWNVDDRESALPCVGRGIAPVFPDAGNTKWPAVPSGNRETLPARILLKKAVHRHDAASPAVGIAEPLILGDGFGAGMDRREIRTLLAEMRDQPPTQKPFHRLSRLGIPPVYELRFVRPSLLIHGRGAAGRNLKPKDSDFYLPSISRGSLCVGVCDMSFRPRDLADSMAGRGQPDGYVRETFSLPREQAPCQGKGLSEIVPEGRLYE
jgi:hypothetical protein